MSLTTEPQPAEQFEAQVRPAIHLALNQRQLVMQLFALRAVSFYCFVQGCDRAMLLRAGQHGDWSKLLGHRCTELTQLGADQSLLLALPCTWSRGLVKSGEASSIQLLLNTGASPVLLPFWHSLLESDRQPEAELNSVPSALARTLDPYCEGLADPKLSEPQDALQLLQLERQLRCQIDAICWPDPHSLGRPLPLDRWLEELPVDANLLQRFAEQLLALLHLQQPDEQLAYLETLKTSLLVGLGKPDPLPSIRLLEIVVGGLNSRRSDFGATGITLRRAALARGAALSDPGDRGLVLMRLLQVSLAEEEPGWLRTLASSIDGLTVAIGLAAEAGDRERKRRLQRQLVALIESGASNVLLLQALLPELEPETFYRLPSLLPPSACLVLMKGVLLLSDTRIACLDRPVTRALLALFERSLPRLWWQPDLLEKLLHDLRRFSLCLSWLQSDVAELLPALLRLHSRGIAPPPPETGPEPLRLRPLAPEELPDEPEDPRRLLRLQLTLLLRIVRSDDDRGALLRLASTAGKIPILRLLDGEDDEALNLAVAAGLPDLALGLVRLRGERVGVPNLLPSTLPSSGGIQALFAGALNLWSDCFQPPEDRYQLPITVLITCYKPRLSLLRQALESLALQSVAVTEVLVVDDGSPQADSILLARFLELAAVELNLPIRLIRQSVNQGQYACRNIAIEQMRSDVLVIHDDDDLSHPLRLELQWQALELRGVAVYASHLRLAEDSGFPQPDGDRGAFWGDGIATLMVRRQTCLDIGGFYPVRSRGDVHFRRRLEDRYGIANVLRLPAPLYLMRGSVTSVSSEFEYSCSLGLPCWRRIMRQQLLP